MRKSIIFLIFIFLSPSIIFSFRGSNELIYVPRATMENMGFLEVGTAMDYFNSADTQESSTSTYFRTALSDNFEYNIALDSKLNISHSFHACFWRSEGSESTWKQYLAGGIKNIGWDSTNNPAISTVYDYFFMYSFSPTSNANYHLGAARSQIGESKDLKFICGMDLAFLLGEAMVEWDGNNFNFGVKYSPNDNYHIYIAVSPRTDDTDSNASPLITCGLSFSENVLDFMRQDLSKTQKSLDEVLKDMQTRLKVVEAKEKAIMEVNSLAFLEQLEDAYIKNKLIAKEMDNDTKSMIKGAVLHMQKGLELYYQDRYEDALEEYEIVISMLPNIPEGYIRLGSIHYKLDNIIDALKAWRQALSLDPKNIKLRKYVRNLISSINDEKEKIEKAEQEEAEVDQLTKEKIDKTQDISSPTDNAVKEVSKKEPVKRPEIKQEQPTQTEVTPEPEKVDETINEIDSLIEQLENMELEQVKQLELP
jgi:tetratricopeptide (TPR) repeat protein